MNNLTENQHVSLESMRGLAAITVAIAHVVQFYIVRFYPDAYLYVSFAAQSSVMVFFSMSGLLIGKSIQSNTIKNGRFMLSVYAESRFKRIYPPLILSIALIIVLNYTSPYLSELINTILSSTERGAMNGNFIYNPSQIFAILTFSNGILSPVIPFNQPLWSLPFEVWYYVIAGLLFTKKPLSIISAMVIFFCISSLKFEFFIYAFVWFSGLIVSYIPAASGKYKYIAISLFIFLATASAFLWFSFVEKKIILGYYNTAFGLFFTSFMYLFLVVFDKKISFLKNTSKYSYTIYITHYPILYFVFGMFESKIMSNFWCSSLVGIASLSLALIFANYSSKIFESKKYINKLM
ncbi:acyltransferase [Aeromonas sp. sif2433]|uniref:acyltransferase family protein n=1 Tax=Aeromonas sp. sif2433 TaxID=2854794 RepID=UPI001C47E52E|nr:acyltransferase [Aeromonas sp. sif2433]MBV7413599.1 acyltransferase [Aeromonas sp. sif2433]